MRFKGSLLLCLHQYFNHFTYINININIYITLIIISCFFYAPYTLANPIPNPIPIPIPIPNPNPNPNPTAEPLMQFLENVSSGAVKFLGQVGSLAETMAKNYQANMASQEAHEKKIAASAAAYAAAAAVQAKNKNDREAAGSNGNRINSILFNSLLILFYACDYCISISQCLCRRRVKSKSIPFQSSSLKI